MNDGRLSAAVSHLQLPCVWLISQFAFQAPSALFSSGCLLLLMQQFRRLSPSFQGGDVSPLGEQMHMAMLLLKALECIGRLSKV